MGPGGESVQVATLVVDYPGEVAFPYRVHHSVETVDLGLA
jgi:hypothetical protein